MNQIIQQMQISKLEEAQNNTQTTDQKSQLIIKGIDVILESNAIKNNIIPFNQNFRIIYSQVGQQGKQKRKSNQIIQISIYKGAQGIKKGIPNFSKEIPIENICKGFYIGSLKNEVAQLSYNNKNIQTTIIFNEIHLDDQQIEPIEVEVSFQGIFDNKNNNLQNTSTGQFCKQIIKISDVRQQSNFENFIQIAICNNNRIIKQGDSFKLLQSQLFVDRIYNSLEEFLKEFYLEESKSKLDFIYDSLQNLPWNVRFSGIDDILINIFMLIQERGLNRKKYYEHLQNENLMIQDVQFLIQIENSSYKQKIEPPLSKNCILIHLLEEQIKTEYFMLVADQKQVFSYGRKKSCDIQLVNKFVSRFNGQIKYQGQNQWTINDGKFDETQKHIPSCYGTWVKMTSGQSYYINSDQFISLQWKYFLKFSLQNRNS